MATTSVMQTYDQKGKKLSFANWIAQLSPEETPFTSMIGSESIDQTMFTWQIDRLKKPAKNAEIEGSEASTVDLDPTVELKNYTQILRKVVKITDSANNTANYGRGKEMAYQLAKAGAELKRDLEMAFLTQTTAKEAAKGSAREFGGFQYLVGGTITANVGAADPETGAVVVNKTAAGGAVTEDDIFGITFNLYLAGAKANTIMFHPKHAKAFAAYMEKAGSSTTGATRIRTFANDSVLKIYVSTLIDPLGQEYRLIPNRWMPEDAIYFFNPSDFDQMVFRAPALTDLAKTGSAETKMIEMETSLRCRHPYCAGVLHVTA